jgi:sortase A
VIEWTRAVQPEEVWVLDASLHGETLTLVTCFPFDFVGAAPQRFIVRARRVLPEKGTLAARPLPGGPSCSPHRPD